MEEFGSIPEPAFVAVPSTAITDLIAKLEAANEGSRALDALIVAAFDHRPAWLSKSEGRLWADLNGPLPVVRWQEAGMKRGYGNPQAYGLAPEVTTSLDAIVALIERKLPGQLPALLALAAHRSQTAQSLALGLCIAFLKATEAGE